MSTDFRIDPLRSARAKIDQFSTAVWVTVCAPTREALDGPEAKQAAISWAQTRYKISGAIDHVQGPITDDGATKPFDPGPDAAQTSGVESIETYRQMAARINVAKIAGEKSAKYVLFVRVRANEL